MDRSVHLDRFDLSAADLRRVSADHKAFTEGLAARLLAALPQHCRVTRRRPRILFGKPEVSAITISADDAVFRLRVERGQLRAERARSVRGVVLSTETLPLPDWMAEISRQIENSSENAKAAHAALREFLLS